MAARRNAPSFRLKVTLIASLLAAVPLVIVGLVVDRANKRGLVDANDELLTIAIGNVSASVDGVRAAADARLSAVAAALADPRADADQRLDLAKSLVATSHTISEVGVYDETGARIDSIQVTADAAPPLPDKLAPALAAAPSYGPVSFLSGRAYILRTAPLVGAAKHWAVAAQVSLAPAADAVKDLALASLPGYTLLLVDNELHVVGDSSGERVGKRATAADAGMLAELRGDALANNFVLVGEFERGDGTRMLGEIRSIDDPFAVIAESPVSLAYQSLSSLRRAILVATLLAIGIAIVAGVLLARRVTQPIKVLVDYAGDLASRRFDRRVTIRGRDEFGVLGRALESAATELAASEETIKKEQAIRSDLGRYLPMRLVDQIVARERDVKLGGQRREITVMFADVVGFTPLAERQPAETVVTMLNELFTILTEIVFRHGGTVDKFVGDCVMAVWGAPDAQPDHASRALAAAADMHRWLDAGNESWQERFGFTVELAIGINTGEAVVGNFGSETRMEYTAIGDVVNVASRLESMARPGQILVAAATRAAAGESARMRSLGPKTLAGKGIPVELYEVLE